MNKFILVTGGARSGKVHLHSLWHMPKETVSVVYCHINTL